MSGKNTGLIIGAAALAGAALFLVKKRHVEDEPEPPPDGESVGIKIYGPDGYEVPHDSPLQVTSGLPHTAEVTVQNKSLMAGASYAATLVTTTEIKAGTTVIATDTWTQAFTASQTLKRLISFTPALSVGGISGASGSGVAVVRSPVAAGSVFLTHAQVDITYNPYEFKGAFVSPLFAYLNLDDVQGTDPMYLTFFYSLKTVALPTTTPAFLWANPVSTGWNPCVVVDFKNDNPASALGLAYAMNVKCRLTKPGGQQSWLPVDTTAIQLANNSTTGSSRLSGMFATAANNLSTVPQNARKIAFRLGTVDQSGVHTFDFYIVHPLSASHTVATLQRKIDLQAGISYDAGVTW